MTAVRMLGSKPGSASSSQIAAVGQRGGLLVTHKGYSGPAVLDLSHWLLQQLHHEPAKALECSWQSDLGIDLQDMVGDMLRVINHEGTGDTHKYMNKQHQQQRNACSKGYCTCMSTFRTVRTYTACNSSSSSSSSTNVGTHLPAARPVSSSSSSSSSSGGGSISMHHTLTFPALLSGLSRIVRSACVSWPWQLDCMLRAHSFILECHWCHNNTAAADVRSQRTW